MTIRVSACSLSLAMPTSADCMRRAAFEGERPGDDADGQSADSLAIWATIGAAPVPVPPPMPAVTKTMSAPLSTLYSSSARFLGGLAADLRVAAGAQAAGQLVADADAGRRLGKHAAPGRRC